MCDSAIGEAFFDIFLHRAPVRREHLPASRVVVRKLAEVKAVFAGRNFMFKTDRAAVVSTIAATSFGKNKARKYEIRVSYMACRRLLGRTPNFCWRLAAVCCLQRAETVTISILRFADPPETACINCIRLCRCPLRMHEGMLWR